jgi:hypothetical protein
MRSISMIIYTLYVKTHRKTGLKYLGQTSKDPFKYQGSGIDWKKHLREFGDDVNTEIIIQTTDIEERNYWGRYYSSRWNIVNAMDDYGYKIWANRIPETGGGGYVDGEIISKAMKREDVKLKRRNTDSKEEVKKRRSLAMQEVSNRNGVNERRSNSVKTSWKTDPKKLDRIQKMKTTVSSEPIKTKIRDSVKKSWEDEETRIKRSGKNSHQYDHTVYQFVHDDGTVENCTREDLRIKYNLDRPNLCGLVKGRQKSHKGWRLM